MKNLKGNTVIHNTLNRLKHPTTLPVLILHKGFVKILHRYDRPTRNRSNIKSLGPNFGPSSSILPVVSLTCLSPSDMILLIGNGSPVEFYIYNVWIIQGPSEIP